MLRWLLYVLLAFWATRLFRLAGRRVSGFDPDAGAANPPQPRSVDNFSSDDIVDADYEDIPAGRPS